MEFIFKYLITISYKNGKVQLQNVRRKSCVHSGNFKLGRISILKSFLTSIRSDFGRGVKVSQDPSVAMKVLLILAKKTDRLIKITIWNWILQMLKSCFTLYI